MRAWLGLLCAGALLAGCTSSGGASPSASATPSAPSPVVSSSPSPSPSRTGPLTTGPGVRPGEKPPVLDLEGLKHTPSGALAFASYYYRALDWSLATSDPYLLKQISADDCQTCRSHISSLEALRRSQEHLKGGRIFVSSFALSRRHEAKKSEYVVAVTSHQEPVALVSPSGAERVVSPASSGTSYVLVSWFSTRWKVVEESQT